MRESPKQGELPKLTQQKKKRKRQLMEKAKGVNKPTSQHK